MGDIKLDIKSIKLGSLDVKLYIGDILLYPKVITIITTTTGKPTEENISAMSGAKPTEEQTLVVADNITKPTL